MDMAGIDDFLEFTIHEKGFNGTQVFALQAHSHD